MNEGIRTFIKKGTKGARKALKNDRPLFFKYLIFIIMSIIGALTILTYPIFALANIKIVRDINETNKFSIEESYKYAQDKNKFWTTTLYILVRGLFFISAIAVLTGFTIGFMYLGETIDKMIKYKVNYVMITFMSIGCFIAFVFIILQSLYLSPTIYLIGDKNLTLSEALSKAKNVMKKRGKFKLVLIRMHYMLKAIIYIGFFAAAAYLVREYLDPLVFPITIIISSFILILVLPKILLSYQVASVTFYEYLVNKYDEEMNENNKLDHNKEIKIAADLLEVLFTEESSDDYSILE